MHKHTESAKSCVDKILAFDHLFYCCVLCVTCYLLSLSFYARIKYNIGIAQKTFLALCSRIESKVGIYVCIIINEDIDIFNYAFIEWRVFSLFLKQMI